MPRRKRDQFAVKVGERITQLRVERNLTREQLGYGHGISKGSVSEIENGYMRPSLRMLKRIADALRVDVFDLVTFPEDSVRHELVDVTRRLSQQALRRLLTDATRPVRPTPR